MGDLGALMQTAHTNEWRRRRRKTHQRVEEEEEEERSMHEG